MDRMTDDSVKGSSYLVYEIERRAYPLGDEPFSIGRDAGSNIVIREPAVSRSHAEVKPDGDGFILNPTGATPTRLNGTPLTGPVQLTDGDRIEIGSVEITFREGRLPLGVSVVDPTTSASRDPDAMTRRSTITNPILGPAQAAPARRRTGLGTFLLLLILIAVAAYYLFMR
jgi:predicted component of type VI protein secretion system